MAPVVGMISPDLPRPPAWLVPHTIRVWQCRQIMALAVECPRCGAKRGQLCFGEVATKWMHSLRIIEGIANAGTDVTHLLPSPDDPPPRRAC